MEENPGAPLMSATFPVGDNTKALLAGLNALKDAGRSGILASTDPAGGKLHYQAVVCPAHLAAGLSAAALTKSWDAALGGKSGGKEAAAMGSAPLFAESCFDPAAVDQLARDFAAKL